jgi:hypothetical protein
MDSRQLLPEECMNLLETIQNADHEIMGSLTIHSGTHPQLGDIVIVASKENDAVLIHG